MFNEIYRYRQAAACHDSMEEHPGGLLEHLVREGYICACWFLPTDLAWAPAKIQNVPVYFQLRFPSPFTANRYARHLADHLPQ